MAEESENKNPFELIVGDQTGEIMNGDVPVRWCVTPALVKQLEDDNIFDPHILLVSATKGGREMQRQLVPITELMTYVRFTRSGDMHLYGFIIDGIDGRKWLHNAYLRKIEGDYGTDIMYQYTGRPYEKLPREYTRTEVVVNIPEGVFGEEPGEWMKWFVNLWHSSNGKVVDECHYRRRMMIAFSVKWIFVALWAATLITIRVVTTGGIALLGWPKDVKFLRSFRPFKWSSMEYHLLDDWSPTMKSNAFFITRKHTSKYGSARETTMLSTLVINPSVLVLIGSLSMFIGWAKSTQGTVIGEAFNAMVFISTLILVLSICWDAGVWFSQWLSKTDVFTDFSNAVDDKTKAFGKVLTDHGVAKYLWSSLGIGVVAGLYLLSTILPELITLMAGIILTLVVMVVVLWKFSDVLFGFLENWYGVAPANNDYTEIRELLCPKDEANLKPDIHYIPPKQRTVRLWYLDIKNKVCKPMQS